MDGKELHITGDPAADKLLSEDAFALLTGMLLDQQVTMESAFAGPEKIRTRLGSITPAAIAAHDPAAFIEMFKERPAVHRFPGSMAARVQALAEAVQRMGRLCCRDLDQGRAGRRRGAAPFEGAARLR
jgi:uncharacterized HhH-GPD family protein